ncbi:MAG: hypothetical protein IIW79_06265 [Clostridia bacterium]|nr:hypothetical protein [Clostridia bacterium]
MDKNELLNLPKEDLIWMIEMLRVSRDTLAADNIRLRNRLAEKDTVDYVKNVARRVMANG